VNSRVVVFVGALKCKQKQKQKEKKRKEKRKKERKLARLSLL